MACNNSTIVYWGGVNFSTATQLFSDVNLTSVAANGWYSYNGVYREMSGGVLGPPTLCPSCTVDCSIGTSPIITGGGNPGKFKVNIDVGSTTGAIVLRFEPQNTPSKLTWTFDNVSASEYSSATWGYKEGVIGQYTSSDNGGSYMCIKDMPLSNDLGSNNQIYYGILYDYTNATFTPYYDSNGNTTPVVMGPYNPSEVNMVRGAAGFFTMVIPKPNAAPDTLYLDVEITCPQNSFNIEVNCPRALNLFNSGNAGDACATVGVDFYTASVATSNGVSSTIAENDWAFNDVNGVTPKPAGQYPVTIGGVTHFVTVDTNGVVTAVVTCP